MKRYIINTDDTIDMERTMIEETTDDIELDDAEEIAPGDMPAPRITVSEASELSTGAFPCNSCGACCRRVGMMPAAFIEAAGLAVDERGFCTLLGKDNRCMDYDNRPPGCRVSDMQKQSGIQEDVYFELTARICNTWMDEDESEYDRLVVR